MIYCNGCRWLNLTEEEQNTNPRSGEHVCNKFKTQVLHHDKHPYLYPVSVCNGDAFEARGVKKEAVNHPGHYQGKIEVIDILESVVDSMKLTGTEAGLTWSVVKYMARWKNKGGLEDLKKAEWYLRRLIECQETT